MSSPPSLPPRRISSTPPSHRPPLRHRLPLSLGRAAQRPRAPLPQSPAVLSWPSPDRTLSPSPSSDQASRCWAWLSYGSPVADLEEAVLEASEECPGEC